MRYNVELTETDVGTVTGSGRTMREAYYKALRQREPSDRQGFAHGFAACFLAMSICRKTTAASQSDAARQFHVRIERHK